jgi:hypothetical protein
MTARSLSLRVATGFPFRTTSSGPRTLTSITRRNGGAVPAGAGAGQPISTWMRPVELGLHLHFPGASAEDIAILERHRHGG